jgi:prepilin-type N-terminal cleavage/methylation domain-containing protein
MTHGLHTPRRGRRSFKGRWRIVHGFTLIELLVVVAILGLLMALLVPSLAGARLKAKVVKAHAELHAVCTALEAYYGEYNDHPPAQSFCAGESQNMEQYFELPAELFATGHLSGRYQQNGRHEYFRFKDPFDPNGCSFKYIKPGVGWGNNHELTTHRIWVPTLFPGDTGEDTCYPTYQRNPDPSAPPWERWLIDKSSPVAFAVWSCGPRGPVEWSEFQRSQDSEGSHLPVPSRNWYPQERRGIIAHLVTSKHSPIGQGHYIASP